MTLLITAVLDLERADRGFALDNLKDPPFLRRSCKEIIKDVTAQASLPPE